MEKVKVERSRAVVSVYLILKDKNSTLLAMRKNTGYFDGYYGLVSGHVEENESAINAMIREAREEVGITILPENLTLKNVSHRKTDRNNIDLFFECSTWEGVVENKEPLKCDCVMFFEQNSLPKNVIPYIKNVLKNIKNNTLYFEEGWCS